MKISKSLNHFINNVCKYKTLSIIGLEKNTGKTTTLNFILNNVVNKTIGITSIGRDGEEKDLVHGTSKPKIYIGVGTLVATAKNSLLMSDATFEILHVLDINTPLGKIVIAKSVTSGFAEISGPSTKSGIKAAINSMENYGANLSIVDGALSRKTFADPLITEALILCIGAAYSENINTLACETLKIVSFFSILEAKNEVSNLYNKVMTECKVAFVYEDKILKSSLKTVIGASEEIISNFNDKLKYIFIKGTLTNSLIEGILNSKYTLSKIVFIIEDSTKLFFSREIYLRFQAKGGSFKVINKMKLIGISVNPKATSGYCLDYTELKTKLEKEIDIPIFNVCE